jgi:membrane protein DedA with SNARE-associated domain
VVLDLIRHYGIFIAAALILLTELGIPTGVPNEVVLLLTGSYAIHSLPGLFAGFFLVTLADITGTCTLYTATRTGGIRLMNRVLRRYGSKPERALSDWRERIGNHDILLIIIGRTVPLVRMSVAVGAGLMRIKPSNFVAGIVPGAIVWAGVPLLVGYIFHGDVQRIIRQYERFSHFLLLILPALILLGVLAFWLHRRQPGTERGIR